MSLRGRNIEFTNPAHTSITSTGPQAEVEVRASGTIAYGIFAVGPISIRASNVTFANTERPSLVSNGPNADIELRSSNLTLAGRILTTGALSHRGSNSTFGRGIYATSIEIRGSNSTFDNQ